MYEQRDDEDVPAFPAEHAAAATTFLASSMHARPEEPALKRAMRTFDNTWRYVSIRYHRYRNLVSLFVVLAVGVALAACFLPTMYRSGRRYTREEVARMTQGGAMAHLTDEILMEVDLPTAGKMRQFQTPSKMLYEDSIFTACRPLPINEIKSGYIVVEDGGADDGFDHLVVRIDDMRAVNEWLIDEHFGPPNGELVAAMPKLWGKEQTDVVGEDFNPCFMTLRMPNGVFLSLINPTIGNRYETDERYKIKERIPILPSDTDVFPFWVREVELYHTTRLHFIQWPGGRQRVLDIGSEDHQAELSYAVQIWQELLEASERLHDVILFQEEDHEDGVIVKDFTAEEWQLYVAEEQEEEEEEEHVISTDDLDYLFA